MLEIPLPRQAGQPLCPVNAVFRAFKFTSGAPATGPAFLMSSGGGFQPLSPLQFVTRIKKDIILMWFGC